MRLPTHPKPSVRHEDGSLWEASYEVDEYGIANWSFGLRDKNHAYYFRKLALNTERRPWWAIWRNPPKYVRTGETWSGGDSGVRKFEILPKDYA